MKKFLHEYLEYSDGTKVDNGWWEIVGTKLVNQVGGWHPYTPHEDDIVAAAENVTDLDWSCLLKPNSKYGWLDLDGKFYGCDFQEHEDLAEKYFKTDERSLEKAGYIKLYRSYPSSKVAWYSEKAHLTKKQRDFLISVGLYENE